LQFLLSALLDEKLFNCLTRFSFDSDLDVKKKRNYRQQQQQAVTGSIVQ